MADFASEVTYMGVEDNKKVHRGTWTNGTTAAKDINTRLKVVTSMRLQQKGTAVIDDAPSINETFPADGSAITIVPTGDTQNGYWEAEGY